MNEAVGLEIAVNSDSCEDCGNHLLLDTKRAEIWCEDCGVVAEENIPNPDYEIHSEGNKSGRPRGEFQSDKDFVGGTFQYSRYDFYGNPLNPSQIKLLEKMSYANHFAYNRNELKKKDLKIKLETYCTKKNIPRDTMKRAKKIMVDSQSNHLSRGRTNEALMVASVRIALSEHGIPKTLKELVEDTSLKKRAVIRLERAIREKFELFKRGNFSLIDYARGVLSRLEIPLQKQKYILEDLKKEQSGSITGTPMSYVAAAIHRHTDHLTQKELANETGVTEVTIRNRYKRMYRETHFDYKYRS